MNIFIDLYMLYIVSYNQINFKMPHVIQFSLFLSLSLSLSLSFSFSVTVLSLSKLHNTCIFIQTTHQKCSKHSLVLGQVNFVRKQNLRLLQIQSFLQTTNNYVIVNLNVNDQSVGNMGVAFVKEANERNEFF